MTGHEYEKLCAQYLECIGYDHVHVTSGSGDQGIDVVAVRNGERIGFQCKLWKSPVSNKAVQEAYGGLNLYGCHRGAVITNSTFTQSAKELARADDIILLEKRTPEMMIDVIEESGEVPCINRNSIGSNVKSPVSSSKSREQKTAEIKRTKSIVKLIPSLRHIQIGISLAWEHITRMGSSTQEKELSGFDQ